MLISLFEELSDQINLTPSVAAKAIAPAVASFPGLGFADKALDADFSKVERASTGLIDAFLIHTLDFNQDTFQTLCLNYF